MRTSSAEDAEPRTTMNRYTHILAPIGSALTVLSVCVATAATDDAWLTDLPTALAKAKAEKKLVLIDFTGSDWCSACIRLRRSVLDTPEFRQYAADSFVLMEVDLPQREDFDPTLRAKNEKIAEQYHIAGYPTVVVLNHKGEVMGGFEGAIPMKDAIQKLDNAIKAEHLISIANMESGVLRARTLMHAYHAFPTSKSFAVARERLRADIMQSDPENVTGIHHEAAVQEQAARFQEERNALPITAPAMGKLLERQLAEAYPANRPAILVDKCQHALATAQTISDIEKAKEMFLQVIPKLPPDEAAEMQHFVDTYFKDPAALLQMLLQSRPK